MGEGLPAPDLTPTLCQVPPLPPATAGPSRTLRVVDWKWTITAVLPVITLVLGAWLSQVSEGRREDAALKREVRVRELDREQARLDRREAFELTHLDEASQCLTRIHLAALLTHMHNAGADSPSQGEAYQQAAEEMTRLQGLILDDDLRRLVIKTLDYVSRLRYSSDDTVTQIADTQELVHASQEALTGRLRAIYRESADAALHP